MITFIDEHRDRFGVEFLCRTLRAAIRGFLTSRGYRAAKSRLPSARHLQDEVLIPEIKRLHHKHYGVYGRRKMHALLRREGWDIGRDACERLMKLAGVRGVRRSKRAFTTKSDPADRLPGDLVNRNFTAVAPKRLWVVDITYVATWRIPAVVATVDTYAGSSKAAIRSAGVSQPNDFRGRPFNSSAITASCSDVNWRRSVPLGRY